MREHSIKHDRLREDAQWAANRMAEEIDEEPVTVRVVDDASTVEEETIVIEWSDYEMGGWDRVVDQIERELIL